MSGVEILVVAVAVTVGAAVQGSIGFGANLVAAPVLALAEPDLVPVPLLVTAVALTMMMSGRDWRAADLGVVAWSMTGRVPGVVVGALVLSVLSGDGLRVLFAVSILAAVGLSVSGWRTRTTPPTLFAAGVASGFGGATVGVGGPPMAIVLQRLAGDTIRGTLAVTLMLGSTLAVAVLAVAGEVAASDLGWGAVLLGPTVLGFAASYRLRHVLDRGWTRPAVLVLSTASALALLIQAAA